MDAYLNPWIWLMILGYFAFFGLTLRWGAKVRDAQRARVSDPTGSLDYAETSDYIYNDDYCLGSDGLNGDQS